MKESLETDIKKKQELFGPENIDDNELVAAQILFASLTHGTNVNELSKLLDYPLHIVKEISSRYWENEIWNDNGVDPFTGNDHLTFCFMSLCGEGRLKRQFDKSINAWCYQTTQAGINHGRSYLRNIETENK